jgi:predicted dehydrogenase|tara:strand:+ start:486 stop:1484 length:999 start_codon:yes stop_codon:yes gene_type:complete
MKKLNVAIAGFGVVGKKRYKILKKVKDVNIVAISDINRNNIPKDKKIKFFLDYHKLFTFKLDAIFISLPNKIAAEATIVSLKKNINVFCEKPPAKNYKDFIKIYNVYKTKKNLKIKYGFNHRYHDSIIIAKNAIQKKRYGKLINIRGLYGKSKIINFKGQWRSSKSLAGGGILLDQGIHLLDILIFFCGDFLTVKSFISNKFWSFRVEDNAYSLIKFKNNVIAMIHSTATQWQHKFRVEIIMEKGQINLNGILSGSKSYGDEKIEIIPKFTKKNKKGRLVSFKKDLSWDRETKEFINALKKNQKIKTGNIEDAKKVMNLVDKIYKSDKSWKY